MPEKPLRFTTEKTLRGDLEASLLTQMSARLAELHHDVDQLTEVVGELAGAMVNSVHELARCQNHLAASVIQVLQLVERSVERASAEDEPAPSPEGGAGVTAESPVPFRGRKVQ